MASLKRLSGAKDVSQDDFSQGVGTYLVKFDAPPAVKIADVKKEIGKFKLEKVVLKITAKVTEKDKNHYAGTLALAGSTEKGAEDCMTQLGELLKKKKSLLVLTGILNEDDKGKQTLQLIKVAELDARKK